MKKYTLALVLGLFMATMAFAEDDPEITSTDSAAVDFDDAGLNAVDSGERGTVIGKLSTGVALGFNTSPLGYTLITQHRLAPRAFGTAHDSTALYVKEVTKGTAESAPGAVGIDNVFVKKVDGEYTETGGWKPL